MTSIAPLLIWLTALAGGDAFTDLPLDKASARAQREGRLLVIDFTATWCSPCKRMDRTTWVDGKVVAWLEEHAIAIKVDGDAQPAVRRAFGVSVFPTVVAVRDGEEVSRVSGYRSGKKLLRWLRKQPGVDGDAGAASDSAEGVTGGEPASGSLARDAGDGAARDVGDGDASGPGVGNASDDGGPPASADETDPVRRHLALGRYDEAAAELVARWDGGGEAAHLSRLTGELLSAHESSREVFAERYAQLSRTLDQSDADGPARDEWVHLGRALGRGTELVAWARGLRQDGAGTVAFAAQDEEASRARIAAVYGAALSAGRTFDASEIAGLMLKTWDDVPARVSLVEAALETNRVGASHERWLTEAARMARSARHRKLVSRVGERLHRALTEPSVDDGPRER